MKSLSAPFLPLLLTALLATTRGAEPPPATPATLPGTAAKCTDPEIVGEEQAVLTPAPNVPPPIQRKHATKVVVKLEVIEVVKRMGV